MMLVPCLVGSAGLCEDKSKTPQERFTEAENTFRFQDYKTAADALYALLYPDVLLDNPDMVLKAREYLGASYFWLGDERRMEEEFTALLVQAPAYQLDPFYYPASLIEKFEQLKGKLKAMHIIEPDKAKVEKTKEQPCLMAKETKVLRPLGIAFIPFGVGQFYNKQKLKGSLVLVFEVLTLGGNIASFVAQERLKGADGFYSPEDASLAKKLRIAQFASLGAFVALVIYGTVDAALTMKREEKKIEFVPCGDMPQGEGKKSVGICFGVRY
jgi:hypothetical protein